MYALCVRRDFDEIAGHAVAFRLSAYRLLESSVLEGEEMFFIECMWEKLVWVMARELAFPKKLTEECLSKLVEFAQPLSLSDYMNQPHWIQESYVEVRVKLQIIQSLAYIDLSDSKESGKIKQMLKTRFIRDFVHSVGPHINQSNPTSSSSKCRLRMLSRTLWSKLLALLSDLTVWTSALPSDVCLSTMGTMFAIFGLVDLIPKPDDCGGLLFELSNTIDMAICCLVLIGLVSSEFQYEESGLLAPRSR
jgi:hypothetical protein